MRKDAADAVAANRAQTKPEISEPIALGYDRSNENESGDMSNLDDVIDLNPDEYKFVQADEEDQDGESDVIEDDLVVTFLDDRSEKQMPGSNIPAILLS